MLLKDKVVGLERLVLFDTPIGRLIKASRPSIRGDCQGIVAALFDDTHTVRTYPRNKKVFGSFIFKKSKYTYLVDCGEKALRWLDCDNKQITNPAILMGVQLAISSMDLSTIHKKLIGA